MALQPGTRLGPYEITATLGAGGMGEVYAAADTRLGRRVAVKVLPELFAADPERLSRFEQEARAAAALNHPSIAAVYDVGVDGPTRFIVQELVAGASLRELLTARPDRPLGEWLSIAADVASALAAAHDAGIVHRDVKPENIMVADSGRAKVLDFGLAKLAEPAGAAAADANSPTTLGTITGTVMGTVGYLSPEQAAGQPADRRSDIFSLGCILYEMAVGERPFAGRSTAEVIAHVLHDEPRPLAERKPHLPAELIRVVGKCLAKEPARRYQHADDLAVDLADLAARPLGSSAGRSGAPAARSTGSRRIAWPVALAVVGAAGLAGWLRPLPAVVSLAPPTRLAIPVPGFGGASTALQRQLAITPDGTTVLYVSTRDGRNQTMRLDLDATQPVQLPGVREFLADYVIAPDGREFIGSVVGSTRMWRYPIDGGTARPVPVEAPATPWVAWASDGTLWTSVWNNATHRIDPSDRVTKLDTLSKDLELGQVLPGDKLALGVRVASGYSGQAVIIDLATGEATPVLSGDVVEARYSAGHLVYVQPDSTMHAVPFDPATRQIGGRPVRLAEGVTLTGSGLAQFAASANGTVVYVPEEPRSLVFVGRDGRSRPATSERRNFHAPMFSPDGTRLATDFTSSDGRDVWVLDLGADVMSRASFDRAGHDPTWMPDGQGMTYLSTAGGSQAVYRTSKGDADGREEVVSVPGISYTGLWLRDGSLVTVMTQVGSPASGATDIVRIRFDGGKPRIDPLVASRFTEDRFAVSRDERWLAFTSNQSGRDEIYVRPLDGSGDQVQVSAAGGIEPVFGPDGRELFYRGGEGPEAATLMRAALVTEPSLAVTSRVALFSVAEMATATPHRNYDISPDGQTFAMVQFNPGTRIMVLQNLPALVRKLAGDPQPAR